jgi:hypothetical protein
MSDVARFGGLDAVKRFEVTMSAAQDRLAFTIPHLISGQAEGWFAITVLAVLTLAALACMMVWVLRGTVRRARE